MKLETFFEKFEQFADAPNAVAKMRELVLQLAVQGGLVQHSEAEPAVPYASVEKATPINVEEVPLNWRVVLLSDAIKTRSGNGKLIKGKLHESPAAHLFQGFSASGADVWCEDYEHEENAIIVSAVGARCGKAFKASGKWSAIANTHIARPESTLFDFDFAYLVLNNEKFWIRGGSAQPFIKFPPSLVRHFALPPLAEQKRIVVKVDELMALCDRLETQQQERDTRHAVLARASLTRFADVPTPANLNFLFHPSYAIAPADLRKTILTLAVQGKLVPQILDENASYDAWSSNNTISKKVMGIQALPNGWSSAQLVSFTMEIVDCPHSTPKWTEYGKICIRTNQFRPGRLDLSAPRYVSEETFTERIQRLRPQEDDILYSREGGILGVACRVPPNVDLCLGQRMMLIRPGEKMIPPFLELILNSPFITDIARRETTGGAAPRVNVATVKAYPIPIPPLAEQRRIVAKVDQLMALVDQLETQLTASRATATNLMEAAVAEMTAQE